MKSDFSVFRVPFHHFVPPNSFSSVLLLMQRFATLNCHLVAKYVVVRHLTAALPNAVLKEMSARG